MPDFKLPELPKIESMLPPLPGMPGVASKSAGPGFQFPLDVNNPSIKSAMSAPVSVLQNGHNSAKNLMEGLVSNAQSSMSNIKANGMPELPFEQAKSMALMPFTFAEALMKPLLNLPGLPGAKQEAAPAAQPVAGESQAGKPAADYSQPSQEIFEAPAAAQSAGRFGQVSYPSSPVSIPTPIVEKTMRGGMGFFTSGPKGTFELA